MIGQRLSTRPLTIAFVAACLVTTTAASAVAASMGALLIVMLILLALAALIVATLWPVTLFYVYCAAIPFNFALPPF